MMRFIARLDIKNEHVIKGIRLEGLRKVGDPYDLACKYYSQGADEILFLDLVASLYSRNNLFHVIERACAEVFIPITIGGGLRCLDDIELALHAGADKIAINTAAVKSPELIRSAALKYGSQSIVASIETKRVREGKWEAYIDSGRERTGLDVLEWAKRLEALGAGELLVTSIDNDGTKNGCDLDLAEKMISATNIPVIFSGGVGKPSHVLELVSYSGISAVACASALHYNLFSIAQFKTAMDQGGMQVRI